MLPVPTVLEGKIHNFHVLSVRFAGPESGTSRAMNAAAVWWPCGNYLSAFVRGRVIASRDVFSESAFLRQVIPHLFSFTK